MELGSLVRDQITGFEGVVTARTTYLNGCERISVQSKTLNDGKVIPEECFDIQQLDIVEDSNREEVANEEVGGPRAVPPRRNCPHL